MTGWIKRVTRCVLCGSLLAILLFSKDAEAFSCKREDVKPAMATTPYVFFGRVEGITQNYKTSSDKLHRKFDKVTFLVYRKWKGDFKEHLDILADSTGYFSENPFVIGKEYIVFAGNEQGFDMPVFNSCQRYAQVRSQDVDFIGEIYNAAGKGKVIHEHKPIGETGIRSKFGVME